MPGIGSHGRGLVGDGVEPMLTQINECVMFEQGAKFCKTNCRTQAENVAEGDGAEKLRFVAIAPCPKRNRIKTYRRVLDIDNLRRGRCIRIKLVPEGLRAVRQRDFRR